MSNIAVKFENVSKYYKLYNSPKDRLKEALHPFGKKRHREFYALKNINLEVKKGEILGIVGKNGSGKSTLLKIISRVVQPNSGNVVVNGEVSALLELGSGMNPDYDGIQNILFGGIMMGFSREEMNCRLNDIIEFAEIGDFIRQPLKTYSSGMKARLGFALAVNISPEILVVDEVLSVGDDLFKRKCYAKMEDLFKSGCTVFFVSHSASSVVEICSRAVLIDEGEIILEGSPKFVTMNYDTLLFGKPDEREKLRRKLINLNKQKPEETPSSLPPVTSSTDSPINVSSLLGSTESNDSSNTNTNTTNSTCIHEAQYLAEFKSKSKTIYKSANIDLIDIHISTLEGKLVNSLFPNDYYYLNYSIKFNEELEEIALAHVFKSEKGAVLSGVRYPPVGKNLPKINKDSLLHVNLKFKCSFLPGNYYLDIGIISFKGGEKQVLSAEYDAIVFKIQNCKCLKDITSSWAYFLLDHEINIKSN